MLLCLSHINCFISQVSDVVVFVPHQLRNKAIGVGQTQQHLKPVKSNNTCVQTQQHLKPVKSDVVVFVPHQLLYLTGLRCCVSTKLLFDFTGLRCCCVCPTPIAIFHKHNNILNL
jgi:hypothetical protein